MIIIRIIFRDGEEFKAEDYKGVIKELKEIDVTNPDNIQEYMKKAKERYSIIGIDVDTSSPENFIESLKKQGVVNVE